MSSDHTPPREGWKDVADAVRELQDGWTSPKVTALRKAITVARAADTEAHQQEWDALMNKTAAELHAERRRWYASLEQAAGLKANDLEGLAPEVAAPRALATLRQERDHERHEKELMMERAETEPTIDAIRARLHAATPWPWAAYQMVHDERGDHLTADEIGEYVKNSVVKSAGESGSMGFLFVSANKPSGPADVCHVGNGPTSPANADFIANAPEDIATLLRAVDRLTQERDQWQTAHTRLREALKNVVEHVCDSDCDLGCGWVAKAQAALTPPAATPQEPERCVWRDISTAPKDGTYIDLWWRGQRVVNCSWWEVGQCWIRRADTVNYIDPSHWMPIPGRPLTVATPQEEP